MPRQHGCRRPLPIEVQFLEISIKSSCVRPPGSLFRIDLGAQIKRIEIVRSKGRDQHAAELLVVSRDFKLFRGAANGEIVDDDLPLLQRALRHAPDLAELQISKVLHAKPNACPENSKHEAQ